ncbi:hypothetical protein QAD02_017893 [Eretmocerus hayati]|uniref:Uncharacterized protein n=1 Tax=Eretmocerus hayati TaxID=131215 RepID=A0ACC2PF54_9HYME|nr:hypothetical protein QAD02_017893 [Eretmocerus hayati]
MGNRVTAGIVNCLTYPCCTVICDRSCRKKSKRSVVILVVGLDNAGKSAIVNYLYNKSLLTKETVVPTIGFRTVVFEHKSFIIRLYDVGGSRQIRALWPKYYKDVHGIIYVVDANDIDRLPESAHVFQDLACHELISQKPILFLGNKQDLDEAVGELNLIEFMNIENIVNYAKCYTRVEICSCYPDKNTRFNLNKNIDKGFKWLLDVIDCNYQDLAESIDKRKMTPKIRRSFRMKSCEAQSIINPYDYPDTDSDTYLKPIVPLADEDYKKRTRRRKKFLRGMFCMPNNRTAPAANRTDDLSIPTTKTMKEIIRSIRIEDLLKNPEVEENYISEYRRPRRKRKRRPNTAPAISKPFRATSSQSAETVT